MTVRKDNLFDSGALASKLKPPRLRYVLERPRLLRMATPVGKQKLVFICAGPGFGKTTLMAQVARYYPGNSVWYQIDSLDHDPAVFLRHLISGIRQACFGSGIGERSMSRLREASDASQEGVSVVAVLVDELAEKLETPLAICFDDFHLFDGVEFASRFMECLLEEMPDNCTVFICSRTGPGFKLGRMRSRGMLLEVGSRDLQFSREELNELLAETWDLQVDDKTLTQLHKNTDGWAAGLVLVEDHLRSGTEVPELFSGRKVRQHVYEYLAEEVLGRQSERLKDLLEKSALIAPVDPHICQRALGVKDAPALLAHAEKMNLFTTRVGDSKLYRYHPLFRENLLARLEERLGAAAIRELRTSFGAAYESAGNKKEAVEQYLRSGQEQKAVDLIEDVGKEMIKSGEQVTLHRWLDVLHDHLSPTLKIYQGRLLILEGKTQQALSLFRAIKDDLKSADSTLIFESTAAIAECCSILGKSLEGIEECRPLLNKRMPVETRLDFLYRLSLCYWLAYDDEGLMACIKEAKKMRQNTSADLLCKIDVMLPLKCLRTGEFRKAEEILLAIVHSHDIDASIRNLSMNNLAYCFMLLGRYEESSLLAKSCLSKVEKQREEKWNPFIYDTYGGCLAALGNWCEGKKYMEKCIAIIRDLDRTEIDVAPQLIHLGTYARRYGEQQSAIDYHSESLAIIRSSNEHYYKAMSVVNLGTDLMRMGLYSKAEEHFVEAHKLSIDLNFRYVLTQIDFHRAWLAKETGNKTKELEFLSAALRRANIYQHNHFIIQEGKISLPLFTTALNHGIETQYVFWILERIGPLALNVVKDQITSDRKEIRARCAQLLGAIADPNSIYLARKLLRDPDSEVRSEARKTIKSLREQIKSPDDLLTQREAQVLRAIAGGASNGKIAKDLFISERTVKTHVTNIFRKLGLTTRLEAALYYQKSLQKNTTSSNAKYNQEPIDNLSQFNRM